MKPLVAILGGGPAGLMAAEVLATAGATVTVYERMPTVGRKLQVAGRGGLNLTHSEPLDAFLDRYGSAREHLAPAIERFGPAALQAWSEGLGEGTFIGSSGRVFPEGFRATTLLRAWLRRLDDLGVTLRTRHTWQGWNDDGALTFTRRDGSVVTVTAAATVLALGGASWPRTGSDGAWVEPVRAAGVDVRPLRPANCGFVVPWSDVFRDRFAGTPVKNTAVRHGGVVARGDLMITRDGIEGGPIYALSSRLRSTIDSGTPALLEVDLFPDTTAGALATRLGRRRPKDSLTTALGRAGMAPVTGGLAREATANQPPTSPRALAALLRMLPLTLTAPQPITRAISTAGGVTLDAINEHAMLRVRPGTFVAGEMLDWEAPTGGYLLQAAFSTGVAAAEGVLTYLGTVQP